MPLVDTPKNPTRSGPICFGCNGRGKVQRYVRRLRRIALVACGRCGGTGHLGSSS